MHRLRSHCTLGLSAIMRYINLFCFLAYLLNFIRRITYATMCCRWRKISCGVTVFLNARIFYIRPIRMAFVNAVVNVDVTWQTKLHCVMTSRPTRRTTAVPVIKWHIRHSRNVHCRHTVIIVVCKFTAMLVPQFQGHVLGVASVSQSVCLSACLFVRPSVRRPVPCLPQHNKKAQLTQRERATAVHVWRSTANKCKIRKNLYFSAQRHSRSLLSVSIETRVW